MTSTFLRSARLCAATVVGLALLALAVPGRAQEADTIPLPDTTEAADTVEIGPRAPGVDTTANFTGTVASSRTGKPISGARVSIPEIQYGAITDEEGRFTIKKLPPGLYDVRVHYLGYTTNPRRVELRVRHTTRAEFRLERTVLSVEDLRVDVSSSRVDPMAGFKRRRDHGPGVFLDRGDIERKNPAHTSDLFRSMAGVSVTPNRMGMAQVSVRRFGRRCRPTIYVDGVLTNAMPVDFVMPDAIIGIEVYRGASEVPPQFNKPTRGEGCGTIVIWTRTPGSTPPGVEPDSTDRG